MNTEKLVVLDTHALIHRAFYAVKDLKTRNGVHTNALMGFFRVLIKILETIKPDYFISVIDMPGKTFRHIDFPAYKATRTKAPEELYSQIPLIYELLSTVEIPILGVEGFEADDLAGSISKNKDLDKDIDVILITGDFDYLQLIDAKTKVIHFKKGFSEYLEYNLENTKSIMRITPNQIIDYKSLVGDSSDNLPGVKGIGKVTAIKLINNYDNLDNIYANIDNIEGKVKDYLVIGKDSAYLTKHLSTIKTDIDINIKQIIKKYNFDEYTDKAVKFCEKYELYLISDNIQKIGNKNAIKEIRKDIIQQETLF